MPYASSSASLSLSDLSIYPLIYLSISIYLWQVPALFSEAFDFNDMRRDLVCNALSSEVVDYRIYVHAPPEGYAARVDSVRTYGAIRCVCACVCVCV
jgi:hypothetical protein